MSWTDESARAALRRLFDAAIRAADPRAMLASHLPGLPKGRVVVVGGGKSGAVMAAAVEAAWPDVPLSGVVVCPYDHAVPTQKIEVVQAAHPVPDAAGMEAARRMLAAVSGLTEDDMVLALMSGGASALMPLPAPGLTLEEKQAVNRALLASGATIQEMNCVRRHLSAIKGGRLAAAAYPARVRTLAISDVPGDDPSVIGSGPTVPDATTFAEARALVAHYEIELPPAVAAHLEAAADETPKPGDKRLSRAGYKLIATPRLALEAAAAEARALGLTPLVLGDAIQGEAFTVGTVLAGMAMSARAYGHPLRGPAVLLSGGETSVTMRAGSARGRGGRNTACLLGFALAAAGTPGLWGLMGDTDGIDGSSGDVAGALAGPDTLERARAAGLDPRAVLASHDSLSLFERLGDCIVTGPTLTNVNDFRAILIA
ncbi:glycerate kinase [Roseomonas sp. GC11]|uniref:glycerate kinase type-2 family protein n=1 Tax=Roseomonas sp. GC11 TaxID=2950546 RepID=UPI00210BC9FF|nr:glycerate kinase [Roseomonas sp. GC11]MCQ4162235.1 glycerate kinase [Roseomonas sp. GC11]